MKTINLTKILSLSFVLVTASFITSCQTTVPSGVYKEYGDANPSYSPPTTKSSNAYQSSDSRSAKRRVEQRSGLATAWGQSLTSPIDHTQFTRSSSRPAGTSSVYYNDKAGIDAMTHKSKSSGKGMQRAASGLVEWGVKGAWGSLANYQSGNRRYIVGNKGSNYSLVVKNISHSRLEVVLSVDGLDVMDGKSASYNKRGYIIYPGKTLTVKGFRTSQSAVAAFKFSTVSSSYANQRHGNTRNIGVIGLAVFAQKSSPGEWASPPQRLRHSAAPFAEVAR
ncbi:MAG: hypothetical protein QM496_22555 [Verrucomicrobiota bacterium]